MGMYDTINGEQVKCFWVPFLGGYNKEEDYYTHWESGGQLRYWGSGDAVPYKERHYNYHPNFLILDVNMLLEIGEEYTNYLYILHTIRDGKILRTRVDEYDDKDFLHTQTVVNYYGDILNIHSGRELEEYVDAVRQYGKEFDFALDNEDSYQEDILDLTMQIETLNKLSCEYQKRSDELTALFEKQKQQWAKIDTKQKALSQKYLAKWHTPQQPEFLRQFGFILSVFERYLSWLDDPDYFQDDTPKKMQYVAREIAEICQSHPEVIGMYEQWMEMDWEEKDEIQRLLLQSKEILLCPSIFTLPKI